MCRKKWREQESGCWDFLFLKCYSVQKGLLPASVISLKLWAHWSLGEWMHRGCGIVRTEQGKTRCKKKIGTFLVGVLQLLVSIFSSLWQCDRNSMKSFLFSYSPFPYMIGPSLPVSLPYIRGEIFLLLILGLCFIVELSWNLFSILIFCTSFLLVNAPKRGLVLMLLHKEEIFVFWEIIQSLLQHLYVLLKNAY